MEKLGSHQVSVPPWEATGLLIWSHQGLRNGKPPGSHQGLRNGLELVWGETVQNCSLVIGNSLAGILLPNCWWRVAWCLIPLRLSTVSKVLGQLAAGSGRPGWHWWRHWCCDCCPGGRFHDHDGPDQGLFQNKLPTILQLKCDLANRPVPLTMVAIWPNWHHPGPKPGATNVTCKELSFTTFKWIKLNPEVDSYDTWEGRVKDRKVGVGWNRRREEGTRHIRCGRTWVELGRISKKFFWAWTRGRVPKR